jgi:arginyl-tRNA synthetase
MGAPEDLLEMLIMQLVHVIERGERSQMSKRKGEFVTLDELIDDIGVDATRFFMLQRSHDTTVDLDLDLARQQSSDNPVYYVQYAHARIASILRKAGEEAVSGALSADLSGIGAAVEPSERALLRRLLDLPGEVREASTRRAPHRLCAYSMAVAADFHAFYRDCKVVGAEGEGVQDARLALCVATKGAIARTLDLLGVGAPERM